MDIQKLISKCKSEYMVFVGLGLASAYWILESVFYSLVSENADFFSHFLSPDINELALRIMVLCFFLIFGSHAQYTFYQKRRADQELEKSQRKHFDLITNMEEGCFETDLDGNFTFANDAFCRITGLTQQTLMGTDLSSLPFFRSSAEAEMTMADLARKRDLEWAIRSADAHPRLVEAVVYPLPDSAGDTIGYLGLARDVTKRAQATRLEQEKRAAEQSSRAKSEFLANMSHEIRTPLNSIIGLIELTLDAELKPEQRDDLCVAKSAAYSLLAVINDILDFSKIEAGKLELDRTEFKLNRFLSDTLRIMVIKASEKNIEVACRVAPDIPNRLIGDPVRFRQVIINLVGNAIKFTEQGEVVVSVRCESRDKDRIDLFFSVKDTGIGILPDKQEMIFGAFDQADGSTARLYGGTGLGLAVSSQLVQLMGGKIWVDSQPDKGSNFQFIIPFEVNAARGESTGEIERVPIAGLRVLVIEDNDTSASVIREILDKWQMVPTVAASQSDAKSAMEFEEKKGAAFDLVLLDEDLNDSDFLQWMSNRGAGEAPGIKIILMTMRYHHRLTPQQKRTVDGLLMKPVSPSDLLDAILTTSGMTHLVCQGKDNDGDTARPLPPLKVLVAEDTGFNQKYISRLLERWGFSARIVTTGRQAVQAAARAPYDIILMDIQMPEMDGLEATRRIRQTEQQSGKHTPIVAMTAHAMKGDKERCLDAGMDSYVAKPISQAELLHTILKLVPAAAVATSSEARDRLGRQSCQPMQHLIQGFGNDPGFFKEIAQLYLEESPPMIRSIQQALEARDHGLLADTAHSLKGMLEGFQAKEAARAALSLEVKGKSKDFGETERLFEKLLEGTDQLQVRLSSLIKDIDAIDPPEA